MSSIYLGKASENLQTLPGTPVSAVTRLVVFGRRIINVPSPTNFSIIDLMKQLKDLESRGNIKF